MNKHNKNIHKNYTLDFEKLLNFLNHHTGKSYRIITDQIKKKYQKRISEGYTKKDIQNTVISAAASEYHIETKFKYLTPEFFSRSSTLDKYGFNSSKKFKEKPADEL